MLKFKFNCQTNTLAYQSLGSEFWYQISEEQTFSGRFRSLGFKLAEGWISFTRYPGKIRVFYKQEAIRKDDFWEPQTVTYYRKDLPKQEEVIFTFSETDQVEKIGNQWVKKGEPTM